MRLANLPYRHENLKGITLNDTAVCLFGFTGLFRISRNTLSYVSAIIIIIIIIILLLLHGKCSSSPLYELVSRAALMCHNSFSMSGIKST